MTEDHLAGLCFLIAAICFSIWWRLRLAYEYRRDNSDDPENYDE